MRMVKCPVQTIALMAFALAALSGTASANTKSAKMPVSVTVKRACKASVSGSHVTFVCDRDDRKEANDDAVRPSASDAKSSLKITTTPSLTTVNF